MEWKDCYVFLFIYYIGGFVYLFYVMGYSEEN